MHFLYKILPVCLQKLVGGFFLMFWQGNRVANLVRMLQDFFEENKAQVTHHSKDLQT